MAKENLGWGYDRIVGAMANLGHRLSDQTVGNILPRHDIPPAPKRKQATSWKDFIRAHMAVLVATDFFTVEVLTLTGLITRYVLFFIHLESRRICLAGVTRHPDQERMEQMARNVTMEDSGFLINRRYLLHDRDSKYCASFRQVIEAGRVKTLALPPRSPNLNAYAERWVRSVKEECLGKLILLGEGSLRSALRHYEAHYHEERNHQGKDNVLLFPLPIPAVRGEQEKVRCRERLGWSVIGVARSSPANFPGVFVEADLADRKKTQDLAYDLIARGNVVGIVNNVGLARHERVDAVDPDVFAMVMDLNVRPALQLTQALLPGMRAARFGRIINITSLVTRGLAFRSSYAAAKAALESITRTMAIELAADGITANAVAPGPTETEL